MDFFLQSTPMYIKWFLIPETKAELMCFIKAKPKISELCKIPYITNQLSINDTKRWK